MGRPPFRCDGNHETLTDRQLTTHHARPCRDDLTAAGAKQHRAAQAAEKAGKPTPSTPTAAFVDHFAATQAPDSPEPEAAPESVPAPDPVVRPFAVDTPSVGSSRRLRALMCIGHTPKDLADHTGLSADSVWWLLIAPPTRIQPSTHRAIAESFAKLSIQPRSLDSASVEGRSANRARAIAELHHWSGPFDWEHIDVASEIPSKRRNYRDPADLAKAIAEAKLDSPVATDTDADHVAHLEQRLITMQAKADESYNQHVKAAADLMTALEAATRDSEAKTRQLAELSDENDALQLANQDLDKNRQLEDDLKSAGFPFAQALTTPDNTPDPSTAGFRSLPPLDLTHMSINLDLVGGGKFNLTLPSHLLAPTS